MVHAADKEPDTDPYTMNLTANQKMFTEELPLTTVEDVILEKCTTKSFIDSQGVKELFQKKLQLTTPPAENKHVWMFSTTFDSYSLVHTSHSDTASIIGDYEKFIFDPGAVDWSNQGKFIPIKGITSQGDIKTFQLHRRENPTERVISPVASPRKLTAPPMVPLRSVLKPENRSLSQPHIEQENQKDTRKVTITSSAPTLETPDNSSSKEQRSLSYTNLAKYGQEKLARSFESVTPLFNKKASDSPKSTSKGASKTPPASPQSKDFMEELKKRLEDANKNKS